MKKKELLNIIDTTIDEFLNENDEYSFGVKQEEPTGYQRLLDAGQRDGFFTGMETSANYITSAAKLIGDMFDKLTHEEKKVRGKELYRLFLVKINKINQNAEV